MKQTNKKGRKCVTTYWRTSLTECFLKLIFQMWSCSHLQQTCVVIFPPKSIQHNTHKHGPWIFDDIFDVQWTNFGALFPDPKMKQTNKKWRKMCHICWWTSLPQYFLEAYFPAVKRYSPTAHMVRDRSHEWQWANCDALYPDPKMQQTNKQKRRKMCHILENFPYKIYSWSLFSSLEEVVTYSTHGKR